ncbi:conserved hypothetical protein [Coccidioides posadasii str. Silveira]|uniref:Uncharacterized protein n=1 Tax=Coccidioides posadasii (strain RMSCC 757 / Silveira) TaxID=443226 RepID=E9DK49_COCPS|nr:conserved hypothetical protein [Coccidioides posadasii str. Silveira]
MSEALDSGHIQHRLMEPALRSKDKDVYQLELKYKHSQKESWCKQFYSLSFLHNVRSIILELHWCFLLCCQGLLYCQFYNIIKKIFTASQHSLFANENLNTLALNSGLNSEEVSDYCCCSADYELNSPEKQSS